jgi:hypothetical protein
VEFWRPGLRESYGRSMTAASVAETLLASHGGGGAWAEALSLAGATLDALETADDRAGRRIAIRFFWNWAGVLGSRPGRDNCASCVCFHMPPLRVYSPPCYNTLFPKRARMALRVSAVRPVQS